MQLSLQTFASLVENMAASIQSAATQLLDLTVGSTLRAILEANASVALWMQWLILQVLQTTRAATSHGADLDTWMADFSLTRLPSAPAKGIVTFSRFTPSNSAFIAAGALVRTSDGSQVYEVISDISNLAYSSSLNGYTIPSTVISTQVPVAALVAGAAGNVQAGSVTLLATAIAGVDTVVNEASFAGGTDPESDLAFRLRFQNYLDSRSRATTTAIGYSITSIQQGLKHSIAENVDSAGNVRMGHVVITVDDGSGSPSNSLLATVSTALATVRPVGTVYVVQPPTVISASVYLVLTVSAFAQKPTVASYVVQAITAYVNALSIGDPLPVTKIVQLAYSADPSVINISGVTINGAAADIVPSQSSVVRVSAVNVE